MAQGVIARRMRKGGWSREVGIAVYRGWARARPTRPGPRVFANSLPKAGTHLLMSMLDAMPGIHFSGRHFAFGVVPDEAGEAARLAELEAELAHVRRSQYMTAHVPYSESRANLLERHGATSLLALRDPRDVAVSLSMYIVNNPRHHMHQRFVTEFADVEARLRAVILGVPPTAESRGLVSLTDRIGRYLGWLDDPRTCTVRYEELLGPQGGGSRDDQVAAVERIIEHLGLQTSEMPVDTIVDTIYSTKSATFRAGRIGDWNDVMTPEHTVLMGEEWQRALQRMGYL
jgi:hypothetical protein